MVTGPSPGLSSLSLQGLTSHSRHGIGADAKLGCRQKHWTLQPPPLRPFSAANYFDQHTNGERGIEHLGAMLSIRSFLATRAPLQVGCYSTDRRLN